MTTTTRTVYIGTSNNEIFNFSGTADVDAGIGDDFINVDTTSSVLLVGGFDRDFLGGGGGGDTIYGDLQSETSQGIFPNFDADIIWGRAGNDRINGQSGEDYINGGSQDDYISGGVGNDFLQGGLGFDTIYGGTGDDTLHGGFTSLAPASYLFVITYTHNGITDAEQSGSVFIDLGDDGSADTNADYLDGGDGNDTIYGGAGGDTIAGGVGNDTVYGGAGSDLMDGGIGYDTVRFDGVTATLVVDLVTRTATGEGSDVVQNFEVIYAGLGSDTLTGYVGGNAFFGAGGGDYMYGAADSDWLQGDAGNDSLFGGTGNDNLVGGADTDNFLYRTYERWNNDTIWDFQDGIDKLNFVGTGLTMASFSISASGVNAVVTYNANGDTITLNGQAGLIGAADFLF